MTLLRCKKWPHLDKMVNNGPFSQQPFWLAIAEQTHVFPVILIKVKFHAGQMCCFYVVANTQFLKLFDLLHTYFI